MSTLTLLDATDLRLRLGDREVIAGVSLSLRHGERLALVGANGSGKSTLLALLAGLRTPDEGSVKWAPGVQVASAGQHIDAPPGVTLLGLAEEALGRLRSLEGDLGHAAEAAARAGPADAATARYLDLLALFEERGGFTASERLRAILMRLGLGADLWQREAAACSGGERRRAQLAGVLSSGAEVLLLDEPTNHLDLVARAALTDALLAHRGALVVASHDRALLDAVATHVLTLGGGRVERRRGSYSDVQRDRAADARGTTRSDRERAKRARELERMAAELARHGHRAAQVRRRRAERERAALAASVPPAAAATSRGGAAIATATGSVRGELVRGTRLRADGVVDGAAVRIVRGERIALVGPSGSGKSTLLELISGERGSDDPRSELRIAHGARLLVLDQTWRGMVSERSPRETLLDWVGEARAASVLHLVGVPREAWDTPAHALSGGERARTGLALLVVREADLLLLDEPTNDLDLPTIETLEATLRDAEAAIVVATHDERLVEALGAEVWSIEAGELVRYRGGVAGYRRGSRRREPGLAPEPLVAAVAPGGAASDRDGDATGREQVDLDAALAQAEEALLDPTRRSARELERWRARRRELEARLLEGWDATAPPPAPRYRTREAGLRVWADRDGDGLRVWLEDGPAVRVRRIGDIGHVVAEPAPDRSVLPWAWRALCHGSARLACYVLPVRSVQVATDTDLAGGPYGALAPGWWVAHRDDLERREGWRRDGRERSADPGRDGRERSGQGRVPARRGRGSRPRRRRGGG
jgi:ATP-binding cassette, subfamily F, member 3